MDTLVNEWVARAGKFSDSDIKVLDAQFRELDAHLTLRTYIVGYGLTEADTAVYKAINSNGKAKNIIKQGLMTNVVRWYHYIDETNPDLKASALPIRAKTAAAQPGDNFEIGLQHTENGVVTRFPPEPSGYLHIGHAKAALLNDYFAHEKYKGTLIVRFDDTNPSNERLEFQDSIVEDLALLGITPDKRTHTSDYFQELYEECVKIIEAGNAYADDTPQEVMREQRMEGLPSARRDVTVAENLVHFEEMKKGTEEGLKWCIRAKMSVDNPNKAMRDPVIYRCNPTAHHRTGETWKIYPTYDFACPIVDALEGITHALRTTEYNDRDPQYQWFIKTLGLRQVYNWGFSRLNFVRTLLSKRKLTKFVETGRVWGWDDPRMPTVRGIRRRGMTVPALREFIIKQGPSRSLNNMDWALFWATNKKYIDPIAARYTAVDADKKVPVTIIGSTPEPYSGMKPKHVKYDLGEKKVWYSKNVIVNQADAASFEQDEEITLMNWGNAIVRKISWSLNPLVTKYVTALEIELHLEGDVKKTKKKVTWLSTDQELVSVQLIDFDYLITKDKLEEEDNYEDFLTAETITTTDALADENVRELRVDDIIQIDRKGYFRVDQAYSATEPMKLFNIPTGKAK